MEAPPKTGHARPHVVLDVSEQTEVMECHERHSHCHQTTLFSFVHHSHRVHQSLMLPCCSLV